MRRVLGFKKRRERDRLLRQITSLEVRLRYFSDELKLLAWHREAVDQLGAARQFLDIYDADGGWICLQAAQRSLLWGMDARELATVAIALREETEKISHWRREAVHSLLKEPPELNALRLSEAFRIRDEYFVNQYHKTRIGSDQLIVLILIGISALVMGLIALTHISGADNNWATANLLAITAFGVMGSAFSVAQSVIAMSDSSKVLEYVANYWATAMRTLFGGITGLAGYVFFASKIIKLNLPQEVDTMAINLTVAFLFGYAGEKLIKKIADSFGTAKAAK